MRSYRFVTVAGIAAGLAGLTAVAVTAFSQPAPTARPGADPDYRGPVATAAGSDAGPAVFPGLVSVHFDRSRAAIAAASTYADTGKTGSAIRSMRAAQGQMAAAWAATRYLIRTTPAPPPPEDLLGANGAAAGGTGFATPPETSLELFTLQHDLATAAAGLLSASAPLNTRLLKTLKATAGIRDRAIAYIHRVAPPGPPPEDLLGARGAAGGTTFDAIMPSVLPLLDDEINALRGTLVTYRKVLPADVAPAVRAVIAQDTATEETINTFWPPLPPDD